MKQAVDQRASFRRRRRRHALIFVVAFIAPGCMSLEEMAPPVGPDFAARSRDRTVAVAVLEQGRAVYLTDCARCHSVEPIARYSAVQWEDIVRRMAPQSKLDEARTHALRAYVLAAHDVLRRRTAATNVVA